jgi:hypothetical protein
MRIAVEARGGGFKIISPDPDADAPANSRLVVDGAPPDISDMDSREYPDAVDSNLGKGYLLVGERSKVLFASTDPAESEQDVITLKKYGGARIDAVTSLGLNSVIVVLDTGELRVLDIGPGRVVTERAPLNSLDAIVALDSKADCGLGRKDPQQYSLRWDPSGVLFAGNRGCNSVTLFDENLDLKPTAPDAELVANPFILEDPVLEAPDLVDSDLFLVDGLDWTVGQPGDFGDCGGDETAPCPFGLHAGGAVMYGVQTIGTNTSFLMLEFIYPDCRHALGGTLECPITNCQNRWPDWWLPPVPPATEPVDPGCMEPNPAKQVLDIAPMLEELDESGILADLDLQPMRVPANMRGERRVPIVQPVDDSSPVDCSDPLNNPPNDPPKCDENGYEIITYFAVNETIFEKTFSVDYKLTLVRADGSIDPCLIPAPGSSIGAINETANIILYNSSDGFPTVDRGGAEGDRGGVISNSFCNGGGTRARWSANTISLEFYEDEDDQDELILNPWLYVDEARRMMAELRQMKETKICAAFPNPEGGPDLGPLLNPLGPDCGFIEDELVHVDRTLGVCLESLYKSRQGNSAENCNAFVTKIANLEAVLVPADWPPQVPANFSMLTPNYEGEFSARIEALEFLVLSYAVNSAPAEGLENRAPILSEIESPQSVDEGGELDVELSATDPDNDDMTLTASGLPAFCSLTDDGDGTGSINCDPADGDIGAFVTVTVTDDGDGDLTDSEIFEIVVNDVLP